MPQLVVPRIADGCHVYIARNETELVVLVQAILAKPVDPRQLALPTDGFAPSSDLDRYFLGHMQNLYAKKPNPDPNGPQSLQGPIGYIIQ